METKDIPKDGPTDWRREPSERRNALLGKLGEELTEAASRCFRAMIQGLDECDPGDGRTNLLHLQDEIADVHAQIALVFAFIGLDEQAIEERERRKVKYKWPWIEGLTDIRGVS